MTPRAALHLSLFAMLAMAVPGYAQQLMDVAPTYRYRNPDGSCVHCSTVHQLHWLGLHDKGQQWKSRYRRGESPGPHRSKMQREGLNYLMTSDGDIRVIEYGLASRRFVGVTWGGAHCVNLVGRINHNGQQYAVILDNNQIHKFKYQPWDSFIAEWKRCGGWAFVITSGEVPPPSPRTWK